MSTLLHNFFNLSAARDAVPFLLDGLGLTLQVSILSIALASTLGLLLAVVRRAVHPPLSWVFVAYVDVLRGMPPVMLMVLVYFGLPAVGIHLPVFAAAVTCLSLYESAYTAEILRGALDAVPAGQRDAARALGLTPLQSMRHVIVPQAFRIAIPPLTNEAISVVKLTSVGFVIGLEELLGQARQAQDVTANATPLIAMALVYLAILLAMSRAYQLLERRMKRGLVYARH